MAGYKAWQKNLERHVNSGEKAIRILAPVKDRNTKETKETSQDFERF
ncbi:MAG: hypothetical protein LUG83_00595 [Lachnospiraceae bacterium]|nr:hypothetical protein [Lachnospiraceae bacterium]